MKTFFILLAMLVMNTSMAQSWLKNFDYVDENTSGFSKVEKNKKVGYVDVKGNVVVPLIYDEGFPFSDGLAAVRMGSKWGYVDMQGKLYR